jgi:hypothetical protein
MKKKKVKVGHGKKYGNNFPTLTSEFEIKRFTRVSFDLQKLELNFASAFFTWLLATVER